VFNFVAGIPDKLNIKTDFMKNRTYLLPHSFQKAGWILLVLVPVVFCLGLLIFNLRLIPQIYSRYFTMISYMVLFTGIFMLTFSKEKEEDEMIMSIRRYSVSFAAAITFILYITASLAVAFIDGFRGFRFPEIYKFHSMISNIMTPILIYLVRFRISIWKMRRQCREEQA